MSRQNDKNRRGGAIMNRYVSRFLALLVVLCCILCVAGCGGPQKPGNMVNIPPLPTPGTARITYTNSLFKYSILYPAQWHLTESTDHSFVRVFLSYSQGSPEAVAFEVTCFANPGQLDAQTVWHQTAPPGSSETGKGFLTLSSQTTAYVARGQGQAAYTVYTLVHKQTACQIVTFETDPANAKIILASVKSFSWQ